MLLKELRLHVQIGTLLKTPVTRSKLFVLPK